MSEGRAPSGEIFGTEPWRVVSSRRGSIAVAGVLMVLALNLVAGLTPGWATVTSWRLPVEPSMIVIVSAPGGSARSPLAAAETGGGAATSGFCAAAASAGLAAVYALTITIGSPPNGSSTNNIHPPRTAPHALSTPATPRETSPGGT